MAIGLGIIVKMRWDARRDESSRCSISAKILHDTSEDV